MSQQDKDRIRAGAYGLAAEVGKDSAAKFLRELANQMETEAWNSK